MTKPAVLLILIAVICLGSLLWMLAGNGSTQSSPAPAGQENPEPIALEALPRQPRIALPPETEPAPEQLSKDPSQAEPKAEPPLSEGLGRLTLEVVRGQSGAQIDRFNLVLSGPDRERIDRWIDTNRIELPLKLGEVIDIHIEAPGFEPQSIKNLSLSETQPRRSLRIELRPAVLASGISLDVSGPSRQPMLHVRLRVLFGDLNRRSDEPLTILWQREASNETGTYHLPDLSPGHYRFEVQALDAVGALAPMQLGRLELSYYGAEQVRIPLQLEAGGLLSLMLRDQLGVVLGTDVMLRLEDAQGKHIETRWIATVDEDVLEAIDMLPAAQRCQLGQALPPGDYTLRLQVKGRELARPLRLEPGQKLEIAVVL